VLFFYFVPDTTRDFLLYYKLINIQQLSVIYSSSFASYLISCSLPTLLRLLPLILLSNVTNKLKASEVPPNPEEYKVVTTLL
jgi:hypothetical protein